MSALIAWPATNPPIGFQSYTFKLSRHTTVLASPFSGARQAMAQPYAMWTLSSAKFAKQQDINASLLRSFLAQLAGQANKFKFAVPDALNPKSGYFNQTGFVNGAGQTGTSLTTSGWLASSLVLIDGDYFTVNNELKQCTGHVFTDGSGNAPINFIPPLRVSPADQLQLFAGNSVNLIPWSNAMTNAAWTKTNCTVTMPGTIVDPTGGTNAQRLLRTATGLCSSYVFNLYPTIYARNYTFSIWLRVPTTIGTVQIVMTNAFGGTYQFNAVTPNGVWTRYSVTGNFPLGNPSPMQVGIAPQGPGSAGDALLMYGAQLEVGNAPSQYFPTTTGDGQPYCIMNSITDDQASWDLTPPVVYDVQLDALECFEP